MMRSPRLAIAALIAALATPAGAALPQLALACSSAPAGQDVPCTISRLSGGKGVYVLFQTSDGTAKAGVDYTAVSRQVYMSAGTASVAIAVHALANPTATGTLTFNAAVAGGAAVVRATGSIVEPPPPPPPVTQICPDGSVIPAASICPPAPVPSPTASWVPVPLTVGGYAFVKGSIPTQACCSGLIIRIVGANADGSMWQGMFYSDASGNFPANNAYWATAQMWFDPSSIAGVAPAP